MNEDRLVYEIVYPYPIWTVWKALTSSSALAEWLMPNDFEPVPGHQFTFHTSPRMGWDGEIQCQVVALEPPHRVAYSWRGGSPAFTTLVDFTLTAQEEQTHLRLEHSGFAAAGEMGLTVRDILGRGWRSHILQKNLPALLAQLAAQSA